MIDNQRRADAIDRFNQVPKKTPQEAAQIIIRGIETNEPRILIGRDAKDAGPAAAFQARHLLGADAAPIEKFMKNRTKVDG